MHTQVLFLCFFTLNFVEAFLPSINPLLLKNMNFIPSGCGRIFSRFRSPSQRIVLRKKDFCMSAALKESEELLHITSKGIEGSYSLEEKLRIQQLIRSLEKQGSEQLYLSNPSINDYYRVSYVIEGKGPNAGTPVGGGFRYGIGRAFFSTEETFQHIVNGTAVNMLYFTLLGCIKGCVTLRGDIEPLTEMERQALVLRYPPPNNALRTNRAAQRHAAAPQV